MKLFRRKLYIAALTIFTQQGFTSDLSNKNQYKIRLVNAYNMQEPIFLDDDNSTLIQLHNIYTNNINDKGNNIETNPRHYIENHSYLEIDNFIAIIQRTLSQVLTDKHKIQIKNGYHKSEFYLEWQISNFIFSQYSTFDDGLHTLAAQDILNNVTYFKQQHYKDVFKQKHKNNKNNIINVYTDSKTQVEYKNQGGKWFLELPYENGIVERIYDKREQVIDELIKWQINTPYYQQPISFASPSYRLFIQAQGLQELNSQKPLSFWTSMFLSYLLVSGEASDVLRYTMTNTTVSTSVVENNFWNYWSTFGNVGPKFIAPVLGITLSSSKNRLINTISRLGVGLVAADIISDTIIVPVQGIISKSMENTVFLKKISEPLKVVILSVKN